jgi:NitT/TauT family transport system substrate-binding protein
VPGIAAYALTETIERQPDVVQAFVTGLTRAQDFITAHSAAEIADVIHRSYLAAFDRQSIEKTLAVYKKTVFLADNVITANAYVRLTAIMGEGRQFSDAQITQVPYATCVDMRFVRRARGLT